MYDQELIRHLRRCAVQIRADLLEMIPAGKTGHLGGSASIADVTAALYFHQMRLSSDPKDPNRDICVFSKGHAVLAQYAAFAQLGYIDREALRQVKTLNGTLQGHPDMDHTPGIEAVTGSLGQGLSVSLGIALGKRLQGKDTRVYCVLGDGELEEGQVWEAAMASAAYHVDHLCAIIDNNEVQATDRVERVMPNGHLADKWRAFGWHVIEIDGHDMDDIVRALEEAAATAGQPAAIIAHTVKGKGFPFAEGKAQYHNAAMTPEEYEQALAAVARMKKEAD